MAGRKAPSYEGCVKMRAGRVSGPYERYFSAV